MSSVIIIQLSLEELKSIIAESIQAALSSYQCQADNGDELLTISQAEAFFDVTRQTIGNWRKQGKVVAKKMGGRVYMRKSELLKAMQ